MKALTFAIPLLIGSADTSAAQQAINDMGKCLVGTTTGDERILLGRWIAYGIAMHPGVSDSLAVPRSVIERTDEEVGDLFSSLMLDRCRAQAIIAISGGSDVAMEQAFRVLGEVAMNELMQAPEVNAQMMGFVDYMDVERLSQLFLEAD